MPLSRSSRAREVLIHQGPEAAAFRRNTVRIWETGTGQDSMKPSLPDFMAPPVPAAGGWIEKQSRHPARFFQGSMKWSLV
jgi:hypothetical protein